MSNSSHLSSQKQLFPLIPPLAPVLFPLASNKVMTTGKLIAFQQSLPLSLPSHHLFQLFLTLQEAEKLLKVDSERVQRWKFAIGHIYSAINLAALTNIGSSSRAIPGFWSCLHWFRLDYMALRVSSYALYLVWALCLWHICALGIVSRRAGVVRYVPLLRGLVVEALDSPLFVMLLATAWTVFEPDYTTEMYSAKDAGVGWKAAVSITIALLYYLFQCLRELHHSATNHSQVSTHLLARFSCHVDLFRISLIHMFEISYFSLSSDHPSLHLILVAGINAVIVAAYYRRVPYYRAFPNAVICGCSAFVCVCSLSVLLGEVVGAKVFPAFGALLVAPVLGGMVFYHYSRTYYGQVLKYYQDRLHKSNLQLFQVELALRRSLFPVSDSNSSSSATVSIILAQYERLKGQQPKAILLWAVDYALNVLQNEPLARLKLAQARFTASSFESDLLELRLNQAISHLHAPEPVEYIQYFERIHVVKQADQRLCHILVSFYSQLASDLPDTKKICAYAQAMDQSIRFLKGEYRALLKDFPKAKEPPSLYASFLEDLMRVYDKAHTVRLRASVQIASDQRLEYADYDSRINFFSRGCGVVFASASPGSLGTITYANELAHMALGYGYGMLEGMSIAMLIPSPYRLDHLSYIKQFLKTSITLKHAHPTVLYLCHSEGFLVECVTNLVITAASGPPVILLGLKPTETFKEVAILTEFGVITACTKEFPIRIGWKEGSVVDRRLEQVAPLLWHRYMLHQSEAYYRLNEEMRGFCVFKFTNIGEKTVKMLFLIDTEAEAIYWSDISKDSLCPIKPNYHSMLSSSITTSTGDYLRSRSDVSVDSDLPRVRRHKRRKETLQKVGQSPRKEVQFSSAELPPKRRPKPSLSIASAGNQLSASTSNSSLPTHKMPSLTLLSGLSHSFQVLKHTTLLTVSPTQLLILILANCLIATLLGQEVHRLVSSNHTNDYLMRQLYVLRIAQTARYIDLANKGIISTSNIPQYRENMLEAAMSCQETQQFLEHEMASNERKREVITWEYMEGEVVMTWLSLSDAINRLVDRAILLQSLPAANLTLSNPSLFYLYRNGLGETLEAAEISLSHYVSNSKETIKRSANATFVLFLPFIAVLLATSIFSICNLRGIQGKVRDISHMLGNVSSGVWREQRRVVADRLDSVHGEEIDLQDRSGNDSKPDLVLFNAFLPGFSIILLFFSISLVWYLVEYCVLVAQISQKMLLWPDVVKTVGSQVTNTLGMWTWMLESFFSAVPGLSFSSVQGLAYRANVQLEFDQRYWQGRDSSLQLFKRELTAEFALSAADFSVIYEGTGYDSGYLRKGYRAGFNIYQEDTKMIAFVHDLPDSRAIMMDLYACTEAVIGARTELYDIYSQNIVKMIEKDVDLLAILVVLHTIIVVFGLGVSIFMVIHRTDRQVKALWRSLRLLPSENQTIGLSPSLASQQTQSQFSLELKPA